VKVVSPAAIAAAVIVSRTRFCVSHHHANSGSLTVFFPALLVRAKIGAVPFGLKKRIPSRKFFGRSSTPQSPVPRKPATAAIFHPPSLDAAIRHNPFRAPRRGSHQQDARLGDCRERLVRRERDYLAGRVWPSHYPAVRGHS